LTEYRAMRIALFLSSLLLSAPAHAVCTTATLERDYRDADVVVHALVTAETFVADDEITPAFRARWGDYSPVTLHRLRVIEIFKGRPGPTINLFETVDSGRFGVELGADYLLFFSYHRPYRGRGSAARGAMYIRHTCGQTKRWKAVTPAEAAKVRALARQQRR